MDAPERPDHTGVWAWRPIITPRIDSIRPNGAFLSSNCFWRRSAVHASFITVAMLTAVCGIFSFSFLGGGKVAAPPDGL